MPDKIDKPEKPAVNVWNSQPHWLAALPIALILVILMTIAFWAGNHHREVVRDDSLGGFKVNTMMGGHSEMGLHRTGGFLDSSNRAAGVVTEVNGSTFTLAGSGATKQVQTSSSTTYTGGDQVKVNDSVAVIGTTDNNVLKADRIIINP